jgi:peptide/nickel transport system substrate-binding protein
VRRQRLRLQRRPDSGEAIARKPWFFVPTSDLTILDPVVTGARPTRNSAYLVFDTLYGIDTEWKAQPQMVEGHTAPGMSLRATN